MRLPPAPPTALWVVPVAELAGVARHVLDVARAGIPGWRVVTLCPEGPLAERLRALGAAVVTGPVTPADGVRPGAREVRRVARALAARVVHSHLAYADLLAALATVGLPCRLVTTEHGIARDDLVYHGTRWRSALAAGAHTLRLRRADLLIAVSASTLDVVRERWHPGPGLATVVIRNGIDRPPGRAAPAGRAAPTSSGRRPGLRVLSLARLAPEKGLEELLAAYAVLARAHPQACLTIAGEGPLRADLERRVVALCGADRVRLPGYVPAAEALAGHDVLVQLSVWENCSYALLDALVAGLGVVATPVGGNRELLPAGVLVERAASAQVAAAVARQGLDVTVRPALPGTWPTVAHMCAQIAAAYRSVTT